MGFLDKIKSWLGIGNSTLLEENKRVPRDDYSYNQMEAKKREKVDLLLDKISKKGIESLTAKEKEFLDRQSKR